MKIDWKRKLTSRKFWFALAGFIAGLIVIFGGSQDNQWSKMYLKNVFGSPIFEDVEIPVERIDENHVRILIL